MAAAPQTPPSASQAAAQAAPHAAPPAASQAASQAVMLHMMRCTRCQRIDTPAHLICRGCLATELEPVEIPGEGILVSWTTIRRAPTRFREEAPYKVVVVDLDAGPRVVGRLSGESSDPSLGDRVAAISDEGSSIQFSMSQA